MGAPRRTNHLDKNPSAVDWARLAAFIDGEGCISLGRTIKKGMYVSTHLDVRVANTDPRLMEWLTATFGGSVYGWNPSSYGDGKWRRGYYWATGAKQAEWVLKGCLPYFVIKRDQAEIGLAHQELSTWKNCGPEKLQQRIDMRDKLSRMKGLASRRKDLVLVAEPRKGVA